MKDSKSQLDYHQNSDDVAQRFAGLFLGIHRRKRVFCHPKNLHTHPVGMLFFTSL
jgi:hypothetical protein